MGSLEIAKLAIAWHRANNADPENVARETAARYSYSAEQTEEVVELVRQRAALRKEKGYWPAW